MQGKIIKGIAGFYYIAIENDIYECRAKGTFRSNNIKPLVGDVVEIDIIDEDKKKGNITSISERKNTLIRPALSNIDLMIIVLAATKPRPALNLLDKYLISMSMQGIKPMIVFNKTDLEGGDEAADTYIKIYEAAGYSCLKVSVFENEGIEEIKNIIKGKSCAFAGPSGVGKSSLTNILFPKACMETGGMSKKTDRGKHTTRHSELFFMGENTYICDTPGFSMISIDELDKDRLKDYYEEFESPAKECKFCECMHLKEPECIVKKEVEAGKISNIRYDNYVSLYEELAGLKKVYEKTKR